MLLHRISRKQSDGMASYVTPKAVSAGVSGTLSVPMSTIVIWLIEMIPTHAEPYHVIVPATVAAALASIFTALVAFAGAYFAPRADPTPDQVAQVIQTHELQKNERIKI